MLHLNFKFASLIVLDLCLKQEKKKKRKKKKRKTNQRVFLEVNALHNLAI